MRTTWSSPDPSRRRLRWARWGTVGTAASGAALVLADAVNGPGGADLGLLGGGLLAASGGAVLSALARARNQPRYPHLGRARAAWEAAGMDERHLRLLDEAYRLRALTPPVGYRDRRTVINPLADAYAIVTSPAWRDPWLADHSLLIDPVEEACEVVGYVHRVTDLLAEVRRQLRWLPPGSAADTYAGYETALLGSLDDALRRAKALTAYRAELRRLEVVLAGSRALSEAQTFGDRVLDVVSESARQELAARQLDDSRAQLRLLEEGFREITGLLSGTPTLPSAPPRPVPRRASA